MLKIFQNGSTDGQQRSEWKCEGQYVLVRGHDCSVSRVYISFNCIIIIKISTYSFIFYIIYYINIY